MMSQSSTLCQWGLHLNYLFKVHFSQLAKFHLEFLCLQTLWWEYMLGLWLVDTWKIECWCWKLHCFPSSLLISFSVHWFYWAISRLWLQFTFFLMADLKPRTSLWGCDVIDAVIPQWWDEFLIQFPGTVWLVKCHWRWGGTPFLLPYPSSGHPPFSMSCHSQLWVVLTQVWLIWPFFSLWPPCWLSPSFSWAWAPGPFLAGLSSPVLSKLKFNWPYYSWLVFLILFSSSHTSFLTNPQVTPPQPPPPTG